MARPEVTGKRLLSKQDVLALIGVSYPALWGWIRDGHFPPARRLGVGDVKRVKIGWLESEVFAWIESRPAQRPKGSKVKAA
jgi:predicted DNA-binding transcriptional regulator AlpA